MRTLATRCRNCPATLARRGTNSDTWMDESGASECSEGVAHEPLPAGLIDGVPVEGKDFLILPGGRFHCLLCGSMSVRSGMPGKLARLAYEAHVCERPQPARLLEGPL